MDAKTPARTIIFGRDSIAKPLIIAFCALLLILLIAALIGGAAVRKLRQPIQYANQSAVAVPASLDELRAATDSVVTALSRSEAPSDPPGDNGGTILASEIDQTVSDGLAAMTLHIDQLDRGLSDAPLSSLRDLSVNYAKQAQRTLAAHNAVAESRQLAAGARDRLTSAARAGYDTGRQHVASPGQLNADARELLSRLSYEWSALEAAVANAADRQRASQIADDGNRFAVELRRLVRGLSRLPDDAARGSLFEAASTLFELGRNEPHYFDHQATLMARQIQLSAERARLVDLARNMSGSIRRIAASNNAATSDTLAIAGSSLDNYQNALIVFLVLSGLTGALTLRRYVFDAVVLRLRRLRETTLRLADGALDATITLEGDDEITDLARALNTFRDHARARAESELRLQERTRQLEAVNRELDDFAYVASHDLRAPLHGVDSLASFVQEDMEGQLPETSARHLGMMRTRIARLHSLLDALLQFSRVGRENMPASEICLPELIDGCISLIERPGFTVTKDIGVSTITVQSAAFEQLVRNLLDNAIKHHDRDEGHIHLSAKTEANTLVLRVEDDGPGIPIEFQERVFGMFQTLKARDDVEGSGIGLTLLRKTLSHVGGRIELISNPEERRGSTFIVHWPLDHEAAADPPDPSASGAVVGMPRPK